VSVETTTRVTVFPALQHKAGRPKPHIVRWKVAGKERSRAFAKRPAARAFQAELTQAAHAGTPFDVTTGLPVATGTTGGSGGSGVTCLELAREVVAAEFATLAATSNRGIVEGLAAVLPALVPANLVELGPARGVVEPALKVALNPRGDTSTLPVEARHAIAWVERHSLPVARVDGRAVAAAEARCATRQDGSPAAARYALRRRAALSKLFSVAVEQGLIEASPLRKARRRRGRKVTVATRPIDRTEVASPALVRQLLECVTHAPLRLHLSVMFYAGLRPSEVDGLRVQDVYLAPPGGRSELHVRRTLTEARRQWSATGDAREDRAPKHTAEGTVRRVPIPHVLAELLGPAIEGKAPDDLVVTTRTGTPISGTNRARGFNAARARWAALQPTPPSDATLRTPYSLRHAAATLWLQVMPPAEVARRLGHSVQVLMTVYANVVPDRGEAYSEAVDRLLATE
jgi:integrase